MRKDKIKKSALGAAFFAAIYSFLPFVSAAEPVAKINDVEYATVDAAMEAAAASGTATTVTLLADSTDATQTPTWYVKSDVTLNAESPVTATFAPTANADGVGANVGGLAYLTSADTTTMRTVTVGENVTLVFTNATSGLNAFYVGRNGNDDFVPTKLVLNGNVRAYQPYLGAQSIMEISSTGSLKAEWSECLQTRWGSSLTVTGTDGGWSKENPQVSLSYVNQRGGVITFKDTFVKIGTKWGGPWTIYNSDGKSDYATKLTLDNASLDGISRFIGAEKSKGETSAYEIELKNGATLTITPDYAGTSGSGYFKNIADGVVKIEAGSLISAVSVENAGKFVIDATGIAEATKVFDYTGAGEMTLASYGTVEVTGGTAYVEDSDLYVKPLASVAKIGETEYKTLGDALAAVAEGKPLTWVDDTTWPVETPVYYAGEFYAATDTKGALEVAIDAANEANADDIAKIYVRPGYATEKGLVIQAHQPMKTSLAIYGNDATLSQKWEPCVEMTSASAYHWLKKDVSLAIYNLHGGAGFWGYRMTDYTVGLTLSACANAHEVMLYGSANTSCKGRTNITVADCTFTATSGDGNNCICTIGPGDVEITDTTFTSVNVNVKNVNGGDNEIAVRNCAFKETKDGGKNIRVRAFESGSTVSLNLERVTFDGAATNNVVVGDDDAGDSGLVTYSIFRTAGNLALYCHSKTAQTTTLDSEKAYMGDNSADTVVTAAQIFEVTASTGSTAKVDLALTDDFLNSLENVKGDTAAEKVAALCEADSNGNPGWVNLVTGIEADKDVAVAAVEDNADGTIEMDLANIASSAVADMGTGSGLQVAFAVDEVDASGNVEKAGEAKSSAAIDVNAVESNAIFSVKVLVRQNGATIASVPTTKLVGVQKTTRKATKTIISVPWGSLAGGSISVAELVMTSNLTAGDKLYVYNVGEKRYDVYTLAADKTWEATAVYTIDENGQMSATSSGKPTETKIARGSGVWLERQDTSRPIVTYGQATNEKQETTMASGSEKEPAWNLVAVPTTESVSLDAIAAPSDDAAKNDKVIVPTDGAPKIFTVENGKWGYSEAVSVTNANGKATGIVRVERKTDAKLEPGTGFWYLNAGSSDKKVNW